VKIDKGSDSKPKQSEGGSEVSKHKKLEVFSPVGDRKVGGFIEQSDDDIFDYTYAEKP